METTTVGSPNFTVIYTGLTAEQENLLGMVDWLIDWLIYWLIGFFTPYRHYFVHEILQTIL